MSERDRIKQVDVSKLEDQRIDELGVQIGEKVGKIINQACLDINKFLEIYGLEAMITYDIKPKVQKQSDKDRE